MPTFRSLSDLGAFLANRVATMPHAEHEALDKASAFFLEKTKEIPGHYQSNPVWPPLAESTVEERTKKGFSPDEPLLRTGALRDSYERRVVDDRHAVIGSNNDLAPLMENGTSRMPPRPVLGAAVAQHGHATAEIVGKRIAAHLAGRD